MNLFVIDTPLQLLNALEARYHFNIGPSSLLILKWNFWPATAFEKLLKEMEWKDVSWFEIDANRPELSGSIFGSNITNCLKEYVWTWRQYVRRKNLDNKLRGYGQVNTLIAGSLINLGYMCHVVNCFPAAEVIAVDDGTFTLDVAAMRRDGIGIADRYEKIGYLKSIKRYVRHRYIEWNTTQPKTIKFFTAYEVPFGPEDGAVPNKYEWLRSRMSKVKNNGYVYFLGQPLIEDGYVDEATYVSYLEKIAKLYCAKKLYYLPHKRESSRTVSIVESRLKFAIKRFNEPIEVALALGQDIPDVLASFHCSALESCTKIFGGAFKAVAIYLPPESLMCGQDSVEGVYCYFRMKQNEFFKVVDV